jgi:hypothetical protein
MATKNTAKLASSVFHKTCPGERSIRDKLDSSCSTWKHFTPHFLPIRPFRFKKTTPTHRIQKNNNNKSAYGWVTTCIKNMKVLQRTRTISPTKNKQAVPHGNTGVAITRCWRRPLDIWFAPCLLHYTNKETRLLLPYNHNKGIVASMTEPIQGGHNQHKNFVLC